jgi:hypothetical protein
MPCMPTTIPPPRPTSGPGSRGGTSRRLPGDMTEAEWQSRVTDTAQQFGWLWFHPPKNLPYVKGGRRVQPVVAGFPDLVLVHERWRRVIFAELKDRIGKPTEKQVRWLRALAACDGDDGAARVEAYLWKPQDWPEVLGILSRTAPPGAE